MAIYRNVQLSFWTDNKVEDEFTPEDKYFYLYLLTNPQTNICGCYEVSYSQLTNQTGYNKDTINRLLDRFENVHKIIKFNKSTKEILILNWYKYNWSKSEDTLKGVLKVSEHIKCKEFKKYIFHVVENIKRNKQITPPIGTGEASDTDTDTDTIPIPVNNNKKFIPPSVSEVAEYCKSVGSQVDAEAFVAFYESKDWFVGKNKMKSWRAAITTWEKRNGLKRIVVTEIPKIIAEPEETMNLWGDD